MSVVAPKTLALRHVAGRGDEDVSLPVPGRSIISSLCQVELVHAALAVANTDSTTSWPLQISQGTFALGELRGAR